MLLRVGSSFQLLPPQTSIYLHKHTELLFRIPLLCLRNSQSCKYLRANSLNCQSLSLQSCQTGQEDPLGGFGSEMYSICSLYIILSTQL